jgi:hypothetical protein
VTYSGGVIVFGLRVAEGAGVVPNLQITMLLLCMYSSCTPLCHLARDGEVVYMKVCLADPATSVERVWRLLKHVDEGKHCDLSADATTLW